ncbi:hypothetical protein EAI_13225 [Harpegnathos saltator]|uniref:Uncharacterized protein n=1 Tax=Harpegnathos saltator TaxID=610380 RepID=E2BTQ2_HARSA|nr:hypothetical protein EAI_13225 [Harpegnathos saltator]
MISDVVKLMWILWKPEDCSEKMNRTSVTTSTFLTSTQSPPALRHSNSEEVEETLRNDAAHSSAAASNYTNCEEMRDIEEVSTEEVQHSRFHAKPFDIHFLLESYPCNSKGGGHEQSDFYGEDKRDEKEEEDVVGEGGEQSSVSETSVVRANITDLTREPAGLSFRPTRDLSQGDIWNLVISLVQSTGSHDILEHFTINVFNVALPSG